MSAGYHHHTVAFGMSSQLLDRVLDNPMVRERLHKPRKVIQDYDMPFVGGYSVNGEHLYLDQHLPDEIELELDGRTRKVSPADFLVGYQGHEPVEWSVMDALGWSYDHAHAGPATGAERRLVLRRLGPGWWVPWQKAIGRYAKADEHEKIKSMPKDYDLRAAQSKPVNEGLLAAIKRAMGK